MRQGIRNFFEIVPLIVFFILYYFAGMLSATKGLLISSIAVVALIYLVDRKLSFLMIFSNTILLIFGGVTIYTSDPTFIKIKPTVLYLSFAALLSYDIWKQKGWIRHILGKSLDLDLKTYTTVSKQWCCFFLVCALLNELIWRTCSEAMWIKFKVFGILALTFIMSIAQFIFLSKKLKIKIPSN